MAESNAIKVTCKRPSASTQHLRVWYKGIAEQIVDHFADRLPEPSLMLVPIPHSWLPG